MPDAQWGESPDDLADHEYPDADEWDDDSTQTVACPECGTDVYDDAGQCPNCGMFLIPDTSVWSGKSVWWIILGLLGIVAVITALAFGP